MKFGVNPFSDRNESSHFLILQEQSVTCNRFFQNIAKLPGKHRCFHFKWKIWPYATLNTQYTMFFIGLSKIWNTIQKNLQTAIQLFLVEIIKILWKFLTPYLHSIIKAINGSINIYTKKRSAEFFTLFSLTYSTLCSLLHSLNL